jgi:hypothetical protein
LTRKPSTHREKPHSEIISTGVHALNFSHLAITILLSIILSGCNGTLKTVPPDSELPGYIKISSGFPAPSLFHGSGIQWNEEYAVSVSHMPFLSNVVHTCSTGCDLVFIKHKAKELTPNWRKAKTGEPVRTVGTSATYTTLMGEGKSKAVKANLNRKNDNTKYSLTDAPVVKGMSGGPIYTEDNYIIGMTVGIFLPTQSTYSARSFSAYVPYETILREWKIFKSRNSSSENMKLNLAED